MVFLDRIIVWIGRYDGGVIEIQNRWRRGGLPLEGRPPPGVVTGRLALEKGADEIAEHQQDP
jgi:hypothetical protein